MRTFTLIALVIVSLNSSAFSAEPWKLRGRMATNINTAPEAGTVEASSTLDVPAAESAPIEVAPAPNGAEYGYAPKGGCATCNGNKGGNGYFNFSWFGGCCEQQRSCCSNIWDNYCSQKKSWCDHGCRQPRCQTCQAAPTCAAPACNTGCNSCGHRGAWTTGGTLFSGYHRPMLNFGSFGFGGNPGCSTCGQGEVAYGKPGLDAQELPEAPIHSAPAPKLEPTPAPKLEPKPAKPMAREAARGFTFPSFRMLPTNYGM